MFLLFFFWMFIVVGRQVFAYQSPPIILLNGWLEQSTELHNVFSSLNISIYASMNLLLNNVSIYKHSNIWIIGVPEREEEEQKIENLFEQIMKENFPNLAKEIDFQEVQKAQRIPKKLDPRRNTPRHIHHNYITQDETEGENLRSSKRKGHSYLQRSSHKTQLISPKRPYRQEGAGKKYSKSWEARTYIQDYCIQQSYHLEWKGR